MVLDLDENPEEELFLPEPLDDPIAQIEDPGSLRNRLKAKIDTKPLPPKEFEENHSDLFMEEINKQQ